MFSLMLLVACGDGSKSEDDAGLTDMDALTLVSVMPSQVSATGGDRVVLEGTGFDTTSVVDVNGVACESTFLNSATEMACVTPAATPGDGTISVVRESDGSSDELPLFIVGDDAPGGVDGDGNAQNDTGASGGEAADTGRPVYSDAVEYCHLQYPCGLSLPTGGTTADLDPAGVYTWVYAEGVTQGEGPGADVQVSIGVGPADTDVATDWTWSSCEYNGDKDGPYAGDMANDEFMGELVAPDEPGTYAYASRVRIGDGPWLYCDLGPECDGGEGSDDGFSTETAGVLTVTAR